MAIRFGVAGTAHWGRTVHIPGLVRARGVKLAGVWGRTPATTRSVAAAHGITAFESFDDMLDAVDAVTFAVPPEVQAELAPRAAASGKHLLLEKPVARSTRSAEAVARAAHEHGVSTLVFFMRRFVEPVEVALREAARRRWDRARIVMHYATLTADTPYRNSIWRQEADAALWDIGPHALSFLLPVLGPVRDVVADAPLALSITPTADKTVAFTLRHADGAVASVSLSLHARPGNEAFEIRFDSATDSVVLPNPALDRAGVFATAATELADNILRSATSHRCDVDFGCEVTRVLEAVETHNWQRALATIDS